MKFLKIITWPFRQIGRLLIKHKEKVLIVIEELACIIVDDLMDTDIAGKDKFDRALKRLSDLAIRRGFKLYDRVLRRIIELEVVKQKPMPEGYTIERILDEGLEIARQAVKDIDISDLVGNNERREAAAKKLAEYFKEQGKQWWNVKRFLHVLIEYAVGMERGDFPEMAATGKIAVPNH